jgi:hypothetical protein
LGLDKLSGMMYIDVMITKIIWMNRTGEIRTHSLGFQSTLSYARDLFRWSIVECQNTWRLSLDERRNSKLKLIEIQNTVEEP